MQMYQLGAAYRFGEGVTIDLIGATRYTQLDTDLNLVVSASSGTWPRTVPTWDWESGSEPQGRLRTGCDVDAVHPVTLD